MRCFICLFLDQIELEKAEWCQRHPNQIEGVICISNLMVENQFLVKDYCHGISMSTHYLLVHYTFLNLFFITIFFN